MKIQMKIQPPHTDQCPPTCSQAKPRGRSGHCRRDGGRTHVTHDFVTFHIEFAGTVEKIGAPRTRTLGLRIAAGFGSLYPPGGTLGHKSQHHSAAPRRARHDHLSRSSGMDGNDVLGRPAVKRPLAPSGEGEVAEFLAGTREPLEQTEGGLDPKDVAGHALQIARGLGPGAFFWNSGGLCRSRPPVPGGFLSQVRNTRSGVSTRPSLGFRRSITKAPG